MTPNNWTLEGKDRTLGGLHGVSQMIQKSDIIYECSLMQNLLNEWVAKGVASNPHDFNSKLQQR
jgi:hypothetical protein